jgi:ADP-ribose pyrophosphatase YjhB (NUDIX family)
MYKVFVNDNPIIFTDSVLDIKKNNSYHYDLVNINEIIHRLKHGKTKETILFCDNFDKMWQDFTQKIKPIYAAGGLVTNTNNDYLLIYRLNKWDLPKGHLEKNENEKIAAIREVEEECGIKNLEISHKLLDTFHIIFKANSYKLKVVHWYKMTTTDCNKPKPQLEEDITEAVWKNKIETAQLLKESYANIQLVFNADNP